MASQADPAPGGHRGPPAPIPQDHPRTHQRMPVRLGGTPERRSASGAFPRRRRSTAASLARIAHWQSTLVAPRPSRTMRARILRPIPRVGSARPVRQPALPCLPVLPALSRRFSPQRPLPVTGWRAISPHSERVAPQVLGPGSPASPASPLRWVVQQVLYPPCEGLAGYLNLPVDSHLPSEP
jgi:hypothetical protein